MAESAVAEAIARLTATAEPIEPEDAGAALDDLDDTQRGAVETVLRHGVSVLTGGPGTGKSRTVAALVRLAEKQGLAVALAAPTGRAAKRLEELAGDAPAATLHRLLGAQGRTGGFARGEEWPLDAELVVVDETSHARRRAGRRAARGLRRRHPPAAGRRPGPAAVDRAGPGAGRPDRVRDRAGGRADHALPAGRRRRDRPAGHRGPGRRAAAGGRAGPRGRAGPDDRVGRGRAPGGAAGHRLDPAAGSASRPTTCRW